MANFTFPNYGLFNSTYYLQQNPDVATSWTGTPLQHYIQFGALEGRAPTAWFNADFYRASYTDLQSMNALQLFNHYCNFGFNEGRVPMLNFSNFNGARYLLDNPDVAAAGYTAGNAISHYVAYGEYEGRAAYAQNGVVINPVVNEGDLYTLTTGVDNIDGTQFNDTFDASQDGTLQSFDSLDGMGGTDTLYATFGALSAATVTPAQLANIEVISATATDATTLNLINGGQVTSVGNQASTNTLTVTNIAAGADLSVSNVVGVDTQFDYANTAGTQTADLTVDGVTASNVPVVPVITVEGVETINVTASGNDSEFVLTDLAANTLNFAGNANLVVDIGGTTGAVSLIDASTMTGDFEIVTGAQAPALGAVVSVLGGLGDDAIDINNLNKTSTYTVTLGAGDDVVLDDTVSLTSTIAGGLGEDTLETTAANAATLSATTPTTYNINGMDQLTLSTAMAGQTIHIHNIDTTIDTVNAAGGNGTVMFNAGSNIVNLTAALAGGAFLVDVDGSATTDSVTINNTASAGAIFGGQNITTTGFETVTINTGSYATAAAQTVGAINVGASALVITGSNSFVSDTGDAITASSINASGLTGAAVLTQTVAAVGTTSITGSSNGDKLIGAATATTIVAGAGNDTATGGVSADSIDGGAGNDSLIGAGGNDTIHGGEGDDIVNMGATLNTGDVIDGGAGTNTLEIGQEVIANYSGATNFSTLRLDFPANAPIPTLVADPPASFSQNVARFTGTTFNTVELSSYQTSYNVSGLADATTVLISRNVGTPNFGQRNNAPTVLTHETDTANNTLSLGWYRDTANSDAAVGIVTVNDTNTLNFVQGQMDAAHTIEYAINAVQVTQINLTGAAGQALAVRPHASAVTGFGDDARAITIDGSANTGLVIVDASSAIAGQNLTITGSTTAANTLTGGAGNDVITGGAAADSLIGGAGNDTINAGTAAVADTVTGGTGVDTITLNVDGARDTVNVGLNDSVVVSTFGNLTAGNVVDGSTLTFAGGVDLVYNFLAGSGATADQVKTGTASNAITSLLGGADTQATATATTEYYLSGSYNTLTGVFTVSANGVGADTLVLNGVTGTTLATNQQIAILVGVDSDNLTTTNFVA